MPPNTPIKNFVVEHKCSLLQYMVDLSGDWLEYDIYGLFEHVQKTFKEASNTTWAGKDFWKKLEHEENLWELECHENGRRRRGHEKGSEYDQLMQQWSTIWDRMLAKNWQYKLDHSKCKWEDVPDVFTTGAGQGGHRVYNKHYEYTAAKLQRVVDSAVARALEIGKPDLALAVQQVHKDALQNIELRDLLEKILTQSANARENKSFQEFVRAAKRKIAHEKERQGSATSRKKEAAKASSGKTKTGASSWDWLHPRETATATERSAKTKAQEPEDIQYCPVGCQCRDCKNDVEHEDAEARKQYNQLAKDNKGRAAEGTPLPPIRDDDATLVDDKDDIHVADSAGPSHTQISTDSDKTWPMPPNWQPSDNSLVAVVLGNLQFAPATAEIWFDMKYMNRFMLENLKRLLLDNPAAQEDKLLLRKLVRTRNNGILGGPKFANEGQVERQRQQSEGPAAAEGAKSAGVEAALPEDFTTADADGKRQDQAKDSKVRQPHPDPLVTKILGHLQYEPAVQKMLSRNKPLYSDANVTSLRARESALEVMRTILEETPAARTSVKVFMERLQILDDSAQLPDIHADTEDGQATGGTGQDGHQDEDGANDEEDEDEDEHGESDNEPLRTRLRSRSCAGPADDTYDRNRNRWTCPMAKETGCAKLFSKAGHAVRHAKTVHEGKKDIECPVCGKLFARNDNMEQHRRGVHKGEKGPLKRSRESRSSSEEAEEADLEEARRAHKRRKQTRRSSNASWNPGQAPVQVNDAARAASESSSLTEFTSEDGNGDEDEAREAYIEQQLRNRSGSEARLAIEAEYGPMSPTDAGATDFGDSMEMTVAEMTQIEVTGIPPPPPPPPEDEVVEGDPLAIISAATASAVAKDPGIARLEAKIDALLNQCANSTPSIKESHSMCDSPRPVAGPSNALVKSPTDALASIAEILQSNAIDGHSPEVTQLIMRMARDAADATIYAGEAMRRVGQLTRNITMVIDTLSPSKKTGVNGGGQVVTPAPSNSNSNKAD